MTEGSKVTVDHRSRGACVYVRQSTSDQVRNNLESQRLQYGLVDRARDLGWGDVAVIDDDLGRSAGGAERPGFQRLLAAVCAGEVGIVFSSEASRLSRNGREWHTLLEFCAVVGCLLADRDTIYDPRLANDRFLLGMQGSVYEFELSVLRQRSSEAQWQKAGRGELFTTVAIGYVRVGDGRIEMDPDQRVRDAVALVFRKFAEFGSGRQVHLWLRQEGIELPAVRYGPRGREVIWKLPVYNSIKKMLANPVYAGAYVWGRSITRVDLAGGSKRIARELRSNVRRGKALSSGGCEPRPTAVAPVGSSQGGLRRQRCRLKHSGDEGPRMAAQQPCGPEREVNAEQASKPLTQKPTLRCLGEGRWQIGKRATYAPICICRGSGASTHGR